LVVVLFLGGLGGGGFGLGHFGCGLGRIVVGLGLGLFLLFGLVRLVVWGLFGVFGLLVGSSRSMVCLWMPQVRISWI